jgi:hypothetical protein
MVRERTGQLAAIDVDDPRARPLLDAAEQLISAAQRGLKQ